MNAQNADQLQGQRQVLLRWPLQALLVRRIRLQMAQVTANLPQHVAGVTLTIYALCE